MEAEESSSTSYTILRIKRKRNEEPLDALVVESRIRRKKSRGGAGLFQFAQTVEASAWDDKERTKDLLQDVITRKAAQESLSANPTSAISASPAILPSAPAARQAIEDFNRRYTIIHHEQPDPESRKFPTSPPKILISKDLPPKDINPDFKMYDAVLTADVVPPPDPEMDHFLPMLNDYLKLNDIMPATPPVEEPVKSSTSKLAEDYVWDVFYHDRAAILGEYDAANVATVTGLPPSLTDDYDSASDSEEEDEGDEDSNAEEYYKNEYPEDEESSDESNEDQEEYRTDNMFDDDE